MQIFLILLTSLGACTNLTTAQRVKSQGLLVFELASNTNNNFNNRYTFTLVGRESFWQIQTFLPSVITDSGTAYYAVWLPEGTYYFMDVEDLDTRLPLGQMLRDVVIKAGTVVDAQTLVLQPVGDQEVTLFGLHKFFVYQAPDQDGSLARYRRDVVLATFGTQPPKIETQDLSISAPADKLAWSRDQTAVLDDATTSYNGTLYSGTKLGRIRVRAPSGEWQHIDVGTLATVMAVYADAHVLIAGLDNGAIRYSTDGGFTWTEKEIGNGYGSIRAIVADGDRGYLIGVRNTPILEVYRLPSLQAPSTLLKKFDNGPKALVDGNEFAHTGHKFFVNIARDKFTVLDLKSGQWSDQAGPEDHSRFYASDSGSTLLIQDMTTYARRGYVSQDAGASWRSVDTPLDGQNLYMGSGGFGFIERKKAFGSYEQMLTRNGGKSWESVDGLSEHCHAFALFDATHDALCETAGGKTYHSADGKPWSEEVTQTAN